MPLAIQGSVSLSREVRLKQPARVPNFIGFSNVIDFSNLAIVADSKLDVTSQLSDDGDQSTKCSDPRTIIYYVAL